MQGYRLRGDDHRKTPAVEQIGSGAVLALAVGLALAGLVGAVALWGGASAGGRAVLVLVLAVALTFAGVVAFYSILDLADARSRVAYNRERRRLQLENLEVALDVDIDGDGVVGQVSELPRVIPVQVQGARLVQDDDGNGADPGLAVLDQVIQAAEVVGLGRRALMGRGLSREEYDWALSVLTALGLVQDRGPRSSGRLAVGVQAARRVVRRAWGVMSPSEGGNGGRVGSDPSPAHPSVTGL
jgi:hypothetical protein